MRINVGDMDRLIRLAVGIGLLAMVVALESGARWFGLIGVVPLATALVRWCPLYTLLGLNTCPATAAIDPLPADSRR